MNAMVNWDNYEEYLILHVDRELNEVQNAELMKFIKLHPEVAEELAAFQSTRLFPDNYQVFTGKEQLLRKEPTRVIALNKWWMYGAAAGIIAIIMFNLFKQPATNTVNQIPIASNKTTVKPANQAKKTEDIIPATKSIQQSKNINLVHSTPINPLPENKIIREELSKVSQLAVKKIQVETVMPELQSTSDFPVLEEIESQPERRNGFLAILPVSENQKEGLETIKNAYNNKIENAKSITENLKNTELSVKVGNKELFVINF
jgi:hypothetical protein